MSRSDERFHFIILETQSSSQSCLPRRFSQSGWALPAEGSTYKSNALDNSFDPVLIWSLVHIRRGAPAELIAKPVEIGSLCFSKYPLLHGTACQLITPSFTTKLHSEEMFPFALWRSLMYKESQAVIRTGIPWNSL